MSKKRVVAPLKLVGRVQHYPWGKVGGDSRIASILGGTTEAKPLAEFWIGDHPKAPALVATGGGQTVSLRDLIERDPEALLGHSSVLRFGARLPFMAKVLSVNGDFGLSIQLHPTKEKAAALHQRSPEHYPDADHKPEIGIALTPVTLLFGFKGLKEVQSTLMLLNPVGEALSAELKARIEAEVRAGESEAARVKKLVSALFDLSEGEVERVVSALRDTCDPKILQLPEFPVFHRLSLRHSKGDRGLLLIFFMNVVRVEPGQGIFIGPNIPHAYLEGDLFECMACSDNVVRGGLTGKFVDTETLVEVMDCTTPERFSISPERTGEGMFSYPTPTEEFQVRVSSHHSGTFALPVSDAPVVLVCLGDSALVTGGDSGCEEPLKDGGALLIPANSGEYRVVANSAQVFCVAPRTA